MSQAESRVAVLAGVRTHYLTAGSGPPVVLLHGGAWGECARTAWQTTIGVLAARHTVIAPDWLGFGQTDKLVDFADRAGRMLDQLAGLLEHLGTGPADMIGLSMGGAHLLRDQASGDPRLPARRIVLVSAGGPPISGSARQALADFDGTLDGMRAQVRLAFADPRWADDDELVRARHEEATRPGAYAAFASLWLPVPAAAQPAAAQPAAAQPAAAQPAAAQSAPADQPGGDRSGSPADSIDYSRITVPTLVTAGVADRLKPPGYAQRVAAAIPGAQLALFDGCGHCPQLEAADAWNTAVLQFLDKEPG